MKMNNQNNNLKVFEGHNVEVFKWEDKVLFNPRNVGECLELTDSAVRMAIAKMNEKQVIKLTNSNVKDIDFRKLHNTGENFLTESGVYKLIFKSHKEEAEKFQDWVTDEVLPTIRKSGTYAIANTKVDKLTEMETETKLNNSQTRKANSLMRMHKECNDPIVKELLFKKAIETLTGKKLIDNTRKTYSAEEIGKKFGISANRVGRIANANNLKTEQYGEMVATEYNDKAQGSTFRYYDTVVPVIENILKEQEVM